jgi:hypothetical protein
MLAIWMRLRGGLFEEIDDFARLILHRKTEHDRSFVAVHAGASLHEELDCGWRPRPDGRFKRRHDDFLALENRRSHWCRCVRVAAGCDQPLNRPAVVERGCLRKIQSWLAPEWLPANERSDNQNDCCDSQQRGSRENGRRHHREWFHRGAAVRLETMTRQARFT